jgi:hypothetical protein
LWRRDVLPGADDCEDFDLVGQDFIEDAETPFEYLPQILVLVFGDDAA